MSGLKLVGVKNTNSRENKKKKATYQFRVQESELEDWKKRAKELIEKHPRFESLANITRSLLNRFFKISLEDSMDYRLKGSENDYFDMFLIFDQLDSNEDCVQKIKTKMHALTTEYLLKMQSLINKIPTE